ncbi:ATP-binding protein [Paenibacillus sp. P26]|nr:ATP-binding protein [Paenibacillus sp. P26]UUZ94538.1 ATP-binding protein [Paenibacillus sp. P25]
MSKLVFFLGPAASGKTSLAKALAACRSGALLDMDTLLRPAAETVMTLIGHDPNDRDSPEYKKHCRDLGYRITMDAALDNLSVGLDTYVIGPFTKELEDPLWLETELVRCAGSHEIKVKAVYVYLPGEEHYRRRLIERGSVLDAWKLQNWEHFRPSLGRRQIKWKLPADSILYLDNSGPLDAEKVAQLKRFVDR